MHYVYILKQSDGEYYAGSTSNLENRLNQHNNDQNTSAKDTRPLKLVWSAQFATKKLAEDFEQYLKSSSGFAFRNKRLIE
jgi:putative endonuclease